MSADFGVWNEFVRFERLQKLCNLPARVLNACHQYKPQVEDSQPLDKAAYEKLLGDTIAFSEASVQWLDDRGLYHGGHHLREVRLKGSQAVMLHNAQVALERRIMDAVVQAFPLALQLHDCFHCGSTFRAEALDKRYLRRPELGTKVTVEYVSALEAYDFYENKLPLPWILFIMRIILESTFGGGMEKARRLGVNAPVVTPEDLLGAIMRAADVCPPDTNHQGFKNHTSIHYGEKGAFEPPQTWYGLLDSAAQFQEGYVSRSFDAVDRIAGWQLTTRAGWQRRRKQLAVFFRQLRDGKNERLAQELRTELKRRLGVELPL